MSEPRKAAQSGIVPLAGLSHQLDAAYARGVAAGREEAESGKVVSAAASCFTCVWWKARNRGEDVAGTCYRFPPTMPNSFVDYELSPRTACFHSCGEYAPLPSPRAHEDKR